MARAHWAGARQCQGGAGLGAGNPRCRRLRGFIGRRGSAALGQTLSADGGAERAEALLGPDTPPALVARLYRQIGNLWHSSDRPRALAAAERAEALYRQLDDPGNLGAVLALLGSLRRYLGDSAGAAAAMGEARALLEAAGQPKALFNVMNNLGVQAFIDGDMAAARNIFEQALLIKRREGARDGDEVLVLINLAEIEFNLGALDRAIARASTAIGFLRDGGRGSELGGTLFNLATYLLMAGRLEEAQRAAREALGLVRPVGGFILRACLQQWALLAACAGRLEDAALLAGFADAGFAAAGEPREPTEQQVFEALRARLEAGMPADTLARHEAEGARWSEARAAAFAARLAEDLAPV